MLIADFTDNGERGKKIEITTFGLRSFQRLLCSAAFSPTFYGANDFYASSILYFLSGLMMMKTG